jgi:hypothetical protein
MSFDLPNMWKCSGSHVPVNGRKVYIVIHFVAKNFSNTPEEISEGACTHTGKTGAGFDSGAGCDVNKWVFLHAAGPAN